MINGEIKYLAHISEDRKREQSIKSHLEGTANLAAIFAEPFGAQEQARLAGELHDIGKYSLAFQRRLHGSKLQVDHSTAGAKEAFVMRQPEVAFAVAGHHAGLPDGGSKVDNADASTFMGRMKKALEPCDAWKSEVKLKNATRQQRFASNGFSSAFYIRMLFSCLVDADYLDTEKFMRGDAPRGGYADLSKLLNRLKSHISKWMQPDNALNERRTDILRACLDAGERCAPGLYTLTVPTGGGKTVSSLAYALTHAVAHSRVRVIYVIPYTSIIDQTADVFRNILGADNVVEHHSGVEYSTTAENGDPQSYRKSLATENWDAPVIVTTAVQFFESLFSNRPARCRKLHNIAQSVVIFDEAQTLPIDYLRPCVATISELVCKYGVTAVLCTATQPALGPLFEDVGGGLRPQEICPEPAKQYEFFRRTELCFGGSMTTSELAAELGDGEQTLCVVNRRSTARQLYELLPHEGRYCLTTLLCPIDRRRLLAEIRSRLAAGLSCRVVSTSLIEAGVDVDFPRAWREEAGLDSVLQTAGRCNREGRRDIAESKVTVFRLDGQNPPSMIRKNVDSARNVMDKFDDPSSLEAIKYYFKFYYAIKGDKMLDKKSILPMFAQQLYPFASVADRFTLIDNQTVALYIPVDDGVELVSRLRKGLVDRELYRCLGQYSVNIYPDHLDNLLESGLAEATADGQYILVDMNAYDREVGLKLDVDNNSGIFI